MLLTVSDSVRPFALELSCHFDIGVLFRGANLATIIRPVALRCAAIVVLTNDFTVRHCVLVQDGRCGSLSSCPITCPPIARKVRMAAMVVTSHEHFVRRMNPYLECVFTDAMRIYVGPEPSSRLPSTLSFCSLAKSKKPEAVL